MVKQSSERPRAHTGGLWGLCGFVFLCWRELESWEMRGGVLRLGGGR